MPAKTFDGLIAVLTSAVAAVGVVFGLFNSFLAELVPPFDDSQQTVGFVSIGTVVFLLALTLLIRTRLTVASARYIGLVSMACFLTAVVVFFPFRNITRTYVYRYPPASVSNEKQVRHIRGDLHAQGVERVKNVTVAQAVYRLGGPDLVNSMGILWGEKSRLAIIAKMEKLYVALTMLLTSAIFISGIALWRRQRPSR